jgi:DNA-binding transcriptional ArsR family regulator
MSIDELNLCCDEFYPHDCAIARAQQALPGEQQVQRLADVFKALGEPTRVRIILALTVGELCVCDLAEVLGMSQSAVSHQLRVLRNLSLVRNRREGKEVFYSLDDDHVVELLHQAADHVQHTIGMEE